MAGNALDGPLWSFALDVYGRAGVPDACIALQDEAGIDVNVMLAALYACVLSGEAATAAFVRRLDAEASLWRAQVVAPLRAIRRAMKNGPRLGPAGVAEDLRNRIKVIELRAEQIELAGLMTVIGTSGRVPAPPREENLQATFYEVLRVYAPHRRLEADVELIEKSRIIVQAATAAARSRMES